MIEKEKFERHLRGTTSQKTRSHRICLQLSNMENSMMISPRKAA